MAHTCNPSTLGGRGGRIPLSPGFKKTPPKIPYKAIALATVLFLIGAFLIIIGSLLLSGYISKGGADRAIPVLIIGILVFLPGFYHLRIAYYASKGYRGYSYDDIPDFDD
uniref:Transmembrane protein 230 n=1 Tax=Pongo abelii TaxID=9601 RepID=A0A8I5YK68_PONAB